MKPIETIFIVTGIAMCSCGKEYKHADEQGYVNYINQDSISNINLKSDTHFTDSTITYKGITFKHQSIYVGEKKYYVVEGDLLLNEDEYFRYKISFLHRRNERLDENKLVGMTSNGRPVKWEEGYVIKYAVIRKSFQDNNAYRLVNENIDKATKEWERTCKVKFYHDVSKDESELFEPSADLTFIVLEYNAQGEFIASSFFPNDPPPKRCVLVDPSYYTTTFDKTGVFRHELGHVLGFRHEHIRSEAPLVCQGESVSGTINLTTYDPKSVMHYFCQGAGSIELKITEIDRKGSQSVYGKP